MSIQFSIPTLYVNSSFDDIELPDNPDYTRLHIIVSTPIRKSDVSKFVDYSSQYETVSIRIKHCVEGKYDLSFLERFPFLDSFILSAHLFTDYEQLEHIPRNIRGLTILETGSQKLSLAFLQEFKRLKFLSLEKHKKDIDVICDLENLEQLAIRSITMPDLRFIGNTSRLRRLRIALGGTKDLGLLPEYSKLAELDLWGINAISNIDPIADTLELTDIKLDQLSKVEDVKSLTNLKKLQFLSLCRMKRLKSLKWASDAPNLKRFSITETTHLNPSDFIPLIENKSLQEASIYIGKKHSTEVREMLGLPEIQYETMSIFE